MHLWKKKKLHHNFNIKLENIQNTTGKKTMNRMPNLNKK